MGKVPLKYFTNEFTDVKVQIFTLVHINLSVSHSNLVKVDQCLSVAVWVLLVLDRSETR